MTKYIDADALLKAIDEASPDHIQEVEFPGYTDTIDFLDKDTINKIISEMPAADVEPVERWISVDERLPEEPYNCLAVVEETDCYTGEDYLTIHPALVGYDGETWNDYDGQEMPVEVTAWLKVPEPPKTDGGSE